MRTLVSDLIRSIELTDLPLLKINFKNLEIRKGVLAVFGVVAIIIKLRIVRSQFDVLNVELFFIRDCRDRGFSILFLSQILSSLLLIPISRSP